METPSRTSAQLNGSRHNDKSIEKLASLKDIRQVKLYNTDPTRQDIDRLRKMLPNSSIEEIS